MAVHKVGKWSAEARISGGGAELATTTRGLALNINCLAGSPLMFPVDDGT